MTLKKKVLISIAATTGLVLMMLFVVAREMAKRFEPYIREQAIHYLQDRFDSKAEIGSLRISVPNIPPLRLLLRNGRGAIARVEGENILLRHRGRNDIAPMFRMKHLAFEVDLGVVFDSSKHVRLVLIDGPTLKVHLSLR